MGTRTKSPRGVAAMPLKILPRSSVLTLLTGGGAAVDVGVMKLDADAVALRSALVDVDLDTNAEEDAVGEEAARGELLEENVFKAKTDAVPLAAIV